MMMSKKQAKAKSAKKTTKKPTHAVAKKKSALPLRSLKLVGLKSSTNCQNHFA